MRSGLWARFAASPSISGSWRSVPVVDENSRPVENAGREWAKAQSIEVKDRGRVAAELAVKFKAATRQ